MFDDDHVKLMIVGFIILFGGIALVVFSYNSPDAVKPFATYIAIGGAIAIVVGLIIAIPNARNSMS